MALQIRGAKGMIGGGNETNETLALTLSVALRFALTFSHRA